MCYICVRERTHFQKMQSHFHKHPQTSRNTSRNILYTQIHTSTNTSPYCTYVVLNIPFSSPTRNLLSSFHFHCPLCLHTRGQWVLATIVRTLSKYNIHMFISSKCTSISDLGTPHVSNLYRKSLDASFKPKVGSWMVC